MFRFSLRKLLILISVLAVLLAGFGYRVNRARRQAAATANLPWEVDAYYDFHHDGWIEVGLDIPDIRNEFPHSKRLVDWFGIDFFATINDVQMVSCEVPFDELQPLFDLGTIEQFAANGTNLDSVEKIAQLKNLKRLFLAENPIEDISPLGEMIDLISLNLRGTPITDVTPLQGLRNLEWLSLEGTKIEEISSLENLKKLKSIDLSDTNVSDVSALSGLTELEEINLNVTSVTDLSPLRSLANVKTLTLSHRTSKPITDISFVRDLKNLSWLTLFGFGGEDIAPVANCSQLVHLTISSDTLSSIESLNELRNLETLYLHAPQLQDLTPIAKHTNLKRLDVSASQVKDLSPLAACRKLKELKLNTVAGDVEFISELPKLAELAIIGCPEHLPLGNSSELGKLRLENSTISRLPDLSYLSKLNELTFNETQISDFTGISKVSRLVKIEITSNANVPDIVIPSLSKFAFLNEFRLVNANVKRLGALPTKEISTLGLEGSKFENFDFLANGNFYELNLSRTNFSDLSILASTKINGSLRLSHTGVTDLKPLVNSQLPLVSIYLDGTDVRDFMPLTSLPALSWAYVSRGTSQAAIDEVLAIKPDLSFRFVDE